MFKSGADRDRTGDLLVANQALSQLSYSPRAGGSTARRVAKQEPVAADLGGRISAKIKRTEAPPRFKPGGPG